MRFSRPAALTRHRRPRPSRCASSAIGSREARLTRRIAIVGAAPSTRDKAPFDNLEWDIWCLGWRALHHPRVDVAFEMHKLSVCEEHIGAEYVNWLKDPITRSCVPTLYVLPESIKRLKKAKPFPIDRAAALMGGRQYFTSSFSYMLSLAILQKPDEIGVWGIDLADGSEYTEQRPCAEFLIGIAMGMGIKVTIAEGSALLTTSWRYGLDDEPSENPLIKHYTKKASDYRAKADELLLDLPRQMAALLAGAHECEEAAKDLLNQARGG